jgi:hypothetical protein
MHGRCRTLLLRPSCHRSSPRTPTGLAEMSFDERREQMRKELCWVLGQSRALPDHSNRRNQSDLLRHGAGHEARPYLPAEVAEECAQVSQRSGRAGHLPHSLADLDPSKRSGTSRDCGCEAIDADSKRADLSGWDDEVLLRAPRAAGDPPDRGTRPERQPSRCPR